MAASQNPLDSQSVQHYCHLHHHCHRHHHRPYHHHAFPNPCLCSRHQHHHLHHPAYAPHGYYAPPIAAPPPFFYPLTLPLTYPPIAAPSNPTLNLSSSGYPAETLYSRSVEGEPDAQELIEEEDDEEPIYVLTDEWREFFAKSEARRKEAKKQARKQRK